MKYFVNCKTVEEVKKLYKTLAKELHPDLNKDRDTTSLFQQMLNEFEKAFEKLKNTHQNKDGEFYTTKGTSENASEFIEIINGLIHLEELTIEIIGCFIWVYGDTFNHKDLIKSLGLKWSKKRKSWYYSSKKIRVSGKNISMDEMREFFGSEIITNQTLQLT